MLLAVDVGNTQTVIGLLDYKKIVHKWRISSGRDSTKDEFVIMLRGLLGPAGFEANQFVGAAMSSVVPSAALALPGALAELVSGPVLVVEPGIKTGMAIKIDNPREVGADRVVNSLAAREQYGAPVVVVDFGTATTFDVVDHAGDYVGGVISPGLEVSMEALVAATSALRRVDLVKPRSVIGKGTVEAIQSGLLYGYAGMVDGILARIAEEIGNSKVVATGGIADTIVPLCGRVEETNDSLTLEGLRLIWERNQ